MLRVLLLLFCCVQVLCHAKIPTTYSIDWLLNISHHQHFIIRTRKIPEAKMNPSIIPDPRTNSKLITVSRVIDKKGKWDRLEYFEFDLMRFELSSNLSYIS